MAELESTEIGFLRFQEIPNPGKRTRVVHVKAKISGSLLGVIKWYGQWRQYVFYPEPQTLFNRVCLDGIIMVVKGMNSDHMKKLVKKAEAHD
jgi:hypothetical protein